MYFFFSACVFMNSICYVNKNFRNFDKKIMKCNGIKRVLVTSNEISIKCVMEKNIW